MKMLNRLSTVSLQKEQLREPIDLIRNIDIGPEEIMEVWLYG